MKGTLLCTAALLALAGTVIAAETMYRYQEGEGMLKLYVSEESGDVCLTLNTVNPNALATCDFESQSACNLTEEGLTCFTEEGMDPVTVRFIDDETLEVVSFPSEYCGVRGNALGRYQFVWD